MILPPNSILSEICKSTGKCGILYRHDIEYDSKISHRQIMQLKAILPDATEYDLIALLINKLGIRLFDTNTEAHSEMNRLVSIKAYGFSGLLCDSTGDILYDSLDNI